MSTDVTVKLQPGTQAPEFTLPEAKGIPVALAGCRGKNVIVYFHPKAATPGCTTQACDFRDNLASLQGAGYDVLASPRAAPQARSASPAASRRPSRFSRMKTTP